MNMQSCRRWSMEQRKVYAMKVRIAQWWARLHPINHPGALSPAQVLAHLREHHAEIFEEELAGVLARNRRDIKLN